MSESGNANAKTCPVCERYRILASMDLCTGCATAAENEVRRDVPAIQRFADRHGTFAEWCKAHGKPDPYKD